MQQETTPDDEHSHQHGTVYLSALKSVLKWLYIGIEWQKDIKSDAFARSAVTASDSTCTCPADSVSLAMSTLLYRIAFAPARKPYGIASLGLLFRNKNSDFFSARFL